MEDHKFLFKKIFIVKIVQTSLKIVKRALGNPRKEYLSAILFDVSDPDAPQILFDLIYFLNRRNITCH